MTEPDALRLKLIGWCEHDVQELRRLLVSSGPCALLGLGGDYVIAVERPGRTHLISSPYAVGPYFYSVRNGQLFHGDTVREVAGASGQAWEWNWSALADLIHVGCVLENETLHARVHRVPSASVLDFRNGQLTATTTDWDSLHPRGSTGPDDAVDALNMEVERWASPRSILSMSGGFDSRVLLSSFLRVGRRPSLLVVGFDESTDVVITRAIARSLGLELRQVVLELQDYLEHAETIASLTNGTTMALDWHPYIFLRKGGLTEDAELFFGTNGEFVRSYGCDRGILASLAQVAAPRSVEWLWRSRLRKALPLRPNEFEALHPQLAAEFSPQRQTDRLSRLGRLGHGSIIPGVGRFYLEQRVRNVHGNSVRLCRSLARPRMPFLSLPWVRAAWSMGQRWKFGSNWHRYAIHANYSPLLDYPEEGVSDRTARRAPRLYWRPRGSRPAVVPYQRCAEWFRSHEVCEFIRSCRASLSQLVAKDTVSAILEEHQKLGNRTRAVSFLLATAAFTKTLTDTGAWRAHHTLDPRGGS